MTRERPADQARAIRRAARAYLQTLQRDSALRRRALAAELRAARDHVVENDPRGSRRSSFSRRSGGATIACETIVGPTVGADAILGGDAGDLAHVSLSNLKSAVETLLGPPEAIDDDVSVEDDNDLLMGEVVEANFSRNDIDEDDAPGLCDDAPASDDLDPVDAAIAASIRGADAQQTEIAATEAVDDVSPPCGAEGGDVDREALLSAIDAFDGAERGPDQAAADGAGQAWRDLRDHVGRSSGFEKIGGIGPGLRLRLSNAGYHSLETLAAADVEDLRRALGPAGRIANVEEWVRRAQALAGDQA